MNRMIAIAAAAAAVALPAVALPTAAQAANDITHTLTLCIDGTAVGATPLTLVANGPNFVFLEQSQDTSGAAPAQCQDFNVRPGQYEISFSGDTPATHFGDYRISRDNANPVTVTDNPGDTAILTEVTASGYRNTSTEVTLEAVPD